jgi:hypothetical protein
VLAKATRHALDGSYYRLPFLDVPYVRQSPVALLVLSHSWSHTSTSIQPRCVTGHTFFQHARRTCRGGRCHPRAQAFGSTTVPATLRTLPACTAQLLSRLLDALRSTLSRSPDAFSLTVLLSQLTYCDTFFASVLTFARSFRRCLKTRCAHAYLVCSIGWWMNSRILRRRAGLLLEHCRGPA